MYVGSFTEISRPLRKDFQAHDTMFQAKNKENEHRISTQIRFDLP